MRKVLYISLRQLPPRLVRALLVSSLKLSHQNSQVQESNQLSNNVRQMNSFSIHFHQLCGFPAQVKEPEPPEEVQLLKKTCWGTRQTSSNCMDRTPAYLRGWKTLKDIKRSSSGNRSEKWIHSDHSGCISASLRNSGSFTAEANSDSVPRESERQPALLSNCFQFRPVWWCLGY